MSELNDKTVLGNLETMKHIHMVRGLLYKMIVELDDRARKHDQSKLESPEAEILAEFTPDLSKTQYGTPEYTALLEKVRPALDHHYANNSHHPEFHSSGIDGMTLLDIVEMFCDWKAATERMHDGNIKKSLDINKKRFGISPQLHKIMENTLKELGW